MKIYDAENQILGRLCSTIAKKLLSGEEVVVVNAEKAIISGRPEVIVKKYFEKIKRGDVHHGPFFPKYPDQIFRRTVRGMLPWDRAKGRKAFKKLNVFIGVPEKLKNKPKEKIKEADASKLRAKLIKFITLEELSLTLGAKKRW
ncbi:MAG: 50S ribosomal protein L13 [Candidatus Aenigmarchaeota archaeon]|nr:50S ribosomal protein L13 [Candidatus Aenigmarchaeota archaeon]